MRDGDAAEDANIAEPRFLTLLRRGYRVLLSLSLRARLGPVLLGLGLLGATAAVGSRVGTEFLPELDEGDLYIFVEMPAGISLDSGQDVLAELRRQSWRSRR